jgi:hypothetical protein
VRTPSRTTKPSSSGYRARLCSFLPDKLTSRPLKALLDPREQLTLPRLDPGEPLEHDPR